MTTQRLLVLGSGRQVFREYALRAMAAHADIVLIGEDWPTWARRYCHSWVPADLTDQEAVLAAVRTAKADGLVTYDERYVELAAYLVERLGLVGPSLAAVHAVKDKTILRAMMEKAGVAPVRHAVAETPAQAHAALEMVGLPAIFKPRALGGSAGVRLVVDTRQVPAAFHDATAARVGTTKSRYPGVLIEEYIDGPEFSIDSATCAGVTTPLLVAEKETGLAPYFEEIGHMVPEAPGALPDEALELVCRAHAIAGLDNMVSHAEVRIGPRGPRLIEINARLGGDLIPYLGVLAFGTDLAGSAARIALGLAPTGQGSRSGAAAVRFIYPARDIRYKSAQLSREQAAYPGLQVFETLVEPGRELLLPPRGYLSRLAVLVVNGASRAECGKNLELAAADLVVTGTSLNSGSCG